MGSFAEFVYRLLLVSLEPDAPAGEVIKALKKMVGASVMWVAMVVSSMAALLLVPPLYLGRRTHLDRVT